MPFWKFYYHIIWATKYRQPIITPAHEKLIFSTIEMVSAELKSDIFGINGVEDHIHVAVAIPPHVAVAEWLKRCKGASSSTINQTLTADDRFRWQVGYGALTFGQKVLPFVVAYIQNQKAHHAEGTVEHYLERID